MPAHPVPAPVYIPIPMPMDNGLLDEDFDIFEITQPCNRKPDTGQREFLCKNLFSAGALTNSL